MEAIGLKRVLEEISYQEFVGNEEAVVRRIIQLDEQNTDEEAIFWCASRYLEKLKAVKQGTVIVPQDLDRNLLNPNCNYILVENPRDIFRQVMETFFYSREVVYERAASAFVDPSVVLKGEISLGHNSVIEKDCVIGDKVIIDHNTVIKAGTIIGNGVIIGCNCTIGGVGFGFVKTEEGDYSAIPHIGHVVIDDDVQIGDSVCVDRAVMGTTHLSRNVKVDNLVHISHGVKIDENSLIIAQAMLAGSVKIGKNVWVAPSSSILNKVSIGDDSTIGLGAVVLKDVKKGDVVVGVPAKPLSPKK